MPDYRKPSQEKQSRPDGGTLPDELTFSIESTSMRLKSLKLRRAEAADRALDDHLRQSSGRHQIQPERRDPGPAGRIRHDERGAAVWDMAVATGEFAALSATNIMNRLVTDSLSIEETQRAGKLEHKTAVPTRDAGNGADPYNQRKEESGSNPYNAHARHSGNPYDSGGGGSDPYNQRGSQRGSPVKRPAPSSEKKSGGSLLDQLTGRKK